MRISSIAELKSAIERGEQVTYAGVAVISFEKGRIVTKEGEKPFTPWLPALKIVKEEKDEKIF